MAVWSFTFSCTAEYLSSSVTSCNCGVYFLCDDEDASWTYVRDYGTYKVSVGATVVSEVSVWTDDYITYYWTVSADGSTLSEVPTITENSYTFDGVYYPAQVVIKAHPFFLQLYLTAAEVESVTYEDAITVSRWSVTESAYAGTDYPDDDDDDDDGDSTVASSTVTLVDTDPSGFYQSIYDYVGIPAPNTADWIAVKNNETYPTPDNLDSLTETFQVNALPFRAYNLIYKEWFRDENLIDSPEVPKDDGVDDGSIYYLRKRAKRHDYFTSALPWTQKGDEVELPLGIVNTLSSSDFSDISFGSAGGDVTLSDPGSGASVTDSGAGIDGDTYIPLLTYDSDGSLIWAYTRSVNDATGDTTGSVGSNYWNGTIQDGTKLTTPSVDVTLTASQQLSMLSSAFDQLSIGPVSINQLREAFQVQRMLERDARSGTRYTEILRGHFGVISPDARLQRPEYLGGGSTPIAINTVAQTGSTNSTSPQGNLAAFGVAASRGNGFSKSFVEHGYIIGIVSIRGSNVYQQGLNRLWTRQTRYDFYWPTLAHLGEQAVYNYEIFFQNSDEDDDVFGYQERYAEYRYRPSQVTGLFRSSYRETLDFWHLAQDFENLPGLNQEFIEESLPVDRIVAVTTEPHFLLDMWVNDVCVRPMPTYSVPGLVDHF